MFPLIQRILVLVCRYFGARRGGISPGVVSGIGLAILLLIFLIKPGSPSTTVIYIIIAAVTTAGILQTAAGEKTFRMISTTRQG